MCWRPACRERRADPTHAIRLPSESPPGPGGRRWKTPCPHAPWIPPPWLRPSWRGPQRLSRPRADRYLGESLFGNQGSFTSLTNSPRMAQINTDSTDPTHQEAFLLSVWSVVISIISGKVLSRGPAHRHAVQFERGDTDADRHRLAVFPAGSYTLIELQIVADHGDLGQRVRAVTDQGAVLERRANLAVFDHVGLGRGKDELAVGDVYLASTEVHRIDAALYRADDVLRRIVAGQHVSVGHARHGDVLIALATAVACVRHAHEFGGELVTQIALQDSFFDQHGVLCGRTFVIDVDGAASRRQRAIVYDRALLRGHTLADESAEGGGAFAIEVGFQTMPDGFVEKNAGPTRPQDNFHLTRRGFARVELNERLPGCLLGEILGRPLGLKIIDAHAPASTRLPSSRVFPRLGDTDQRESGQGLDIRGISTV